MTGCERFWCRPTTRATARRQKRGGAPSPPARSPAVAAEAGNEDDDEDSDASMEGGFTGRPSKKVRHCAAANSDY